MTSNDILITKALCEGTLWAIGSFIVIMILLGLYALYNFLQEKGIIK